MFTKARYSVHCSSSLCLKPFHASSALGVSWEDFYAGELFIIAESLEECVRRLLTWIDAMEKGLRVNAGKTKIMICGPHAEFRRVSMSGLSHWSGQQQHLLQWPKALGVQEMQRAQVLDKDCDYRDVHDARELHAPWTADHRGKSKSDLTSWRW